VSAPARNAERASSPLAKPLEIQGWMSAPELAFLHCVALSIPRGATVVEVGSWKGRSTAAICEGLKSVPDAKLFAVDTFAGEAGNTYQLERYMGELAEDRVYREFRANTEEYSFVEVLRMSSLDASRQFADDSIDWIFIDAEHTFERVTADIRAWFPKLKRGGLVSGHDYPKFAVRCAVDTRLPNVQSWESIWYTRRASSELAFRPLPHLAGKARASLGRVPILDRNLRKLRSQRTEAPSALSARQRV
jgi:predicted O-methyltransferase YrrM